MGQGVKEEEIERKNNNKEDNMEGEKHKIPNFQMKHDPEAYLVWEMKVDIYLCFLSVDQFSNNLNS